MPFAAIVCLMAVLPPDAVEMSGTRYAELVAGHTDDGAERVAWPMSRKVVITRVEGSEGGLRIRATWTMRALGRLPYADRLLGPGARVVSATFNGKPATLINSRTGIYIFGEVDKRATIELDAYLDADPVRQPVAIEMLPAVTGSVDIEAEGHRPTLLAGARGQPAIRVHRQFLAGDERLKLSLESPREPATGEVQALAVARVGMGLTVGDAAIRGRARVVWEVRRGELGSVSLNIQNLGDDLEVTGPAIREVRRQNGQVNIDFQAPIRDRVEVELSWSRPVSSGTESRAELPRVEPMASYRTEAAVQLARSGEVEAVPSLSGWQPQAAAELPTWAQGLVEGTPTSAYTTSEWREGHLDLLRFVPVAGPPVVIDIADYTVATSHEGRSLMTARYEIRNERAAFLSVQPPPGSRIVGARVAGETALPARGQGGTWLIPLQRSVETVEGLLTFAVEVTLIGDTDVWRRRERRALALPIVDAPIAVSRVTLYLPPGYRNRLEVGRGDTVDDFDRGQGITYGFGVGDVNAARADAVYQRAVRSWLDNDFDAAQQDLDELRNLGAANDNISRLQSNLDVVEGRASGKDKTLERRVKEQARARALSDQTKQEQLWRQADESYRSGNYEQAQTEYKKALDLGKNLARLEQEESVEQEAANEVLEQQLVVTEKQAKRTRKRRRWRSKSKHKVAGGDRGENAPSDAMRKSEASVAHLPAPDMISVDTKEKPGDSVGSESGDGIQAPMGGQVSTGVSTINPTTITTMDMPVDEVNRLDAPADEPMPQPEPEQPSEGVTFAGTSDVLEDSPRFVQRRDRRFERREARRDRRRGKKSAGAAKAPPADPNQALAGPKVTASAMSVVIPSAGQRVRYQRVLLQPSATFSIQIDAKKPLLQRRR